MLTTLAVDNYRSIRHLVLPLGRLTVVTGANGTGKSSLYRALRVLGQAARNGAVGSLAREGGLASTLWAGPENGSRDGRTRGTTRRDPVGLRLGFGGDPFGYAIDLGLPASRRGTAFEVDPEIKAESIWHGPSLRPSTALVERSGGVVRIRDAEGTWVLLDHALRGDDSMLGELGDPQLAPEVFAVREQVRSWRFYDQFRTDPEAPARAVQVGTRTPVLGSDGADLAAALQTIIEAGDESTLRSTVDRAFPGSRIAVAVSDGLFEVTLRQPGLLRPLRARELSEGTLRYLLLAAALLSTRPPGLLVLNEPETSLHPDLLTPLAALVAAATEQSQVLVVTHARPLVAALAGEVLPDGGEALGFELESHDGETVVADRGLLDEPPWSWPRR